MKLLAAAAVAAMLGASTVVALPAAGASVTGRAPAASAPSASAHAAATARCFWVDRLAPRGSGAAPIRYWTPARTAATASFSQANLAKALTSQRSLQAEPPKPALTRLCLPVSTEVPSHGAVEPPAVPASRAINGYKTVGKFFFRVLQARFNCTASVIGRNIIVTAAHCFKGVVSGIKYTTTDWMFAPMWHDNKFPFGKWSVHSVYLVQSWINKLNPRFDYAIVILKRRSGRGVGYYTGQDSWNSSLSLAPRQSRPVRIVGIPGNSSKALISVTRAVAVDVRRHFEVLRASTPGFGNGTSGGPWFHPFRTKTDTGTVIGVTGGYQAGGATDSPSYADFLTGHFSDLMAAAIKGITHCNSAGDCRYWPS
jgi:Trypsin-like peptidase domain